jgi:thioester reductase-like protein/aryl carrier-like protein
MFALTNVIILFNATVVLGPPNKPPTGELLVQVMQAYKLRAIWCPPTIIEQLLQEPSGLQEAALLDFIMYTGGPLAPFSGDQLSQVTDICQVIGSTETGLQFALVPSRENWRYFEWHPIISNQMEHIGEGVYEMVVRQDHSMAWIRQMSHTLPEADEYRTKDLFVQHPSNPSLWRFHGRRDDIVVLSNGEKFNPVTMEAIVQGHPLVQGALIVGTARFQAALIVEPKKGICLSSVELTNEIWPCIEKANNEGPAHGRITRSKITVATPNKPFVRAAKGTVIRHSTVKLYTTEVEMLYSDPDDNQTQGLAILESQPGLDVLKTFVHTSAVSVLSNSNLDNSDDLFVHGLDSLQTLELTNRLREGVRPHITASQLSIIAPRAVYANPTVDGIAKLLNDFLNPPPLHMEGLTNGDHAKEDRDARMGAIVDKYTKGFPVAREQSQRCTRSSGMITVVLTGSTGSLGTALLEVFLKDPNIAKVYCFNRSANAKLRHQDNFLSRGVQCDLDSKTEFLTVELGHDTFGLDAGKFAEVKENVDVIIHNAWKLDFNHQLQSFEEVHIRGVCKFIDWAIDSPLDPHIFFVSSLASVSQWNSCYGTKDPVPESPLTNYNVSDNLGYGESKHVSERILNFAVERCGIRASILRVGQIAGPVAAHGGEWNRTEWLPILLKTSKTLGRLPNRLSVIDWIPVDKLAQIITDLIHHGFTANKSEIYNLVNPNIAQWSDLVPGICKHWGATKTEIIDFATWINILKATDPDDPDKLITLPALKLLDFFEDLEKSCREPSQPPQTYATDHARDSSQKMCSLEPIDSKAMKIWLNNWQF